MTRKSRAEAVLLCLTLIWGSTFVVGKLVLRDMSPLQMIAIRFTVGVAFILAFFYRAIFPLQRAQVVRGSILGLFLFLGFVPQTVGLTITTASKSAFITGMMVVFVPLLQVVIERRAPKVGNILGVAIVSAGLWFLTSPSGSSFNMGDALTLLCAVLFGLYIVYLDVIARDMSAVQLTFMQMITNAVLALVATALFDSFSFRLATGSMAGVLYLTFFATILTTFMQTRYQKDTTPTRAVIIFTIEPVFAAVSAAVVLGERLGLSGMAGGAMIVAGVLLSELSEGIPVLNRPIGITDS